MVAPSAGPRSGFGRGERGGRSRGVAPSRAGSQARPRRAIPQDNAVARDTNTSARSTNTSTRDTNIPPRDTNNSTRGSRGRGRGGPSFANKTKYFGTVRKPSPLSPTSTKNAAKESWRDPAGEGNGDYKERMHELWTTLKKNREKERKDAIRDGYLADPDKPTSLADAITPVGTCQDMCPEFERVERIVQQMVDGAEKTTAQSSDTKVPCEEYMVKRFRRSAAGYDEQLPSDIRPPLVLQKTLDYLFDDVVGGPQPLANVHKFVWDRTRGIRNDFSIQQVTKVEDLRIAITCFERIARFHILSLHQLSHPSRDNGEFDHHQEREQLNNTLLSLMYYYDDSRHKLTSPNEAEFRAYCIIFEIQDQRPDLEDRAQTWPKPLLKDQRIQTALKLYAAASNTSDDQGPLRPRTRFPIAQANYGRFWSIIDSNAVSYLMACTAEIYFNFVRSMALDALWNAYRRGGSIKLEDWILGDLMNVLGFDTEDQACAFCEDHGFTVGEREDGNSFLDLSSVAGKTLADSNPRRKQIFSQNLVECKRFGRTLPAVINGLTTSQARANGMVDEWESTPAASPPTNNDDESLFLSDDENSKVEDPPKTRGTQALNPTIPAFNPFAQQSTNAPNPNPFQIASTITSPPQGSSPFGTFGQPSSTNAQQPTSFFNKDVTNPPSFNFLATPPSASASTTAQGTSSSIFGNPSTIITPSTSGTASVFGRSTSIEEQSAAPKGVFGTSPATGTSAIDFAYSPGQSSGTTTKEQNTTLDSNSVVASAVTEAQLAKAVQQAQNFKLPPVTSVFGNPQIPMFDVPSSDTPQKPSIYFSPTVSSSDDQQEVTKPFQSSPQSKALPATSSVLSTSMEPKPSASPFSFVSQPTNPLAPTTPQLGSQSFSTSIVTPEGSLTSPGFKPPAEQTIETTSAFAPNLGASSSTLGLSSIRFQPQSETFGFKPYVSQKKVHQSNKLNTPSMLDVSSKSMGKANVGPPKPDPRPKVLDSLAHDMFCENEGILEQFIDYTVGPMIEKAITRVKNERDREVVANARRILLSIKYLRRWKEIAWKRGLMRKGKERRRTFAQSMQALSQSTGRQSLGSSHSAEFGTRVQGLLMPPPVKISEPSLKRKSLPNGSNIEPQHRTSKKRQHDADEKHALSSSILTNGRPTKAHHKRSRTVGNVDELSQSQSQSQSQSLSSKGSDRHRPSASTSSFNGNASLVSESMIKEARRFVPGPTDTTRTDYFLLKARGIDPDTPIVPRVARKRRISDYALPEAKNKPVRLSPPSRAPKSTTQVAGKYNSASVPRSAHTSHVNGELPSSLAKGKDQLGDEDDELFMQMRAVKEAMSESINWFREEREKSTRSEEGGEGRPETPAEKRLREFQRDTPSRTSIRLKETGARGLWPRVPGKGKSNNLSSKPEHPDSDGLGHHMPFLVNQTNDTGRPMGFSALKKEVSTKTAKDASAGTGASADDAIEL